MESKKENKNKWDNTKKIINRYHSLYYYSTAILVLKVR